MWREWAVESEESGLSKFATEHVGLIVMQIGHRGWYTGEWTDVSMISRSCDGGLTKEEAILLWENRLITKGEYIRSLRGPQQNPFAPQFFEQVPLST